MSLFGALSSGVSGLVSQSSSMGAISDNITNVSTIGYKNTRVDFQTLVTKQTSTTLFSPGGVQSKPRQDTGVQGLLQASSSSTDISISGQGYFIVNEAGRPTISNQFLFTRAGSFFQDNEGFLRNTSGFFLQGWPTNAAGEVIPANTSLSIANQNIISTDFLATVNLSRVGGTASATSSIGIGANVPSNDTAGTTHRTDVQFFDSLGNANNISLVYTKAVVENQWGLDVEPPSGAAVLTVEDPSDPTPKVFGSAGQLEFNIPTAAGDTTRRPADGSVVVIDGVNYEFDNKAFAQTTASLTNNFVITEAASANAERITAAAGTFTGLAAGDLVTTTGFSNANNNVSQQAITTVAGDGSYIEFANTTLGTNETNTSFSSATATTTNSFTTTNAGADATADRITAAAGTFTGLVVGQLATTTAWTTGGNNVATQAITAVAADGSYIEFADGTLAANETDTNAVVSTGFTTAVVTFFNAGAGETTTQKRVDVSGNTTLAQDVASLVATVKASDSDYADDTNPTVTNDRIVVSAKSATTVVFKDDGRSKITVDPTGLLDSTGTLTTIQKNSFTVKKQHNDYTDEVYFKFAGQPGDTDTIQINQRTYEFDSNSSITSGNISVTIGADIGATLDNLVTAIETNDPNFAPSGTRAQTTVSNSTAEPLSTTTDTLLLTTLPNNPAVGTTIPAGTYNVVFSANFGTTVTSADDTATDQTTYASPTLATNTVAIQTKEALIFNSDGLPQTINVKQMEILDYSNGASNMDNSPVGSAGQISKKIALDLGTVGGADGFTQFGASFTPVFITQDGSRFGTFAGVTVANDGLMTALFDNGETRTIFQLPLATFVNVNKLESKSGNVWNATERSGDPTLRVADNGPAGQTVQSALEASTVDIGEEFTKMIVVQRAFSASTKIITTADDMLDELLRAKR